ncbi:tyrosine-protein kinase BAZ1B isoform X2 [Sinocyclocheilus grahami]|uniref:tyrosine-protein kinase BAZ1B isoform X2 n=1 Tax=Sinocyclocheilus grahami TaxID=75366 RepID=UPI0007ACADE0|nr:PREDICTED: tyrosine-protein kinase BAZ1B isoform X2 [Sinocyclocheilus grahami]
MAPLLGRKPYPLVKPLSEPPGPAEEVFIIEHTKEAFRNKEEYEARLRRYAERIWTCKSTGSSQLTHKEAWEEEQEVTELLQEEYPVWFEKPVLEIVHHNTVSLDKLVDLVWLEILTKYAVDEECDFLVGKDKTLHVKVVKMNPLENPPEENVEKKMEGACDSPSSDKENASQENLKKEPQSKEEDSRRESLSDRARRSPRKLPTSMKEEKKKWVMPKFLPHKYDVKLLNEDKVISDVPADSLFRTERPPNKEIMRYFIRHYALRLGSGESAPWVVEDELVKKYNLPSKFSDFLLDPHKFLAENPSAKRKSMSSPEGKPNKKLKTAETGKDSEGVKVKGEKKKKKKDSQNIPLSPTLWGHMQVKKVNGSPLKMKNSGTSKKCDGENILSAPKLNKKQGDKKSTDPKKSRKSGVTKTPNGQKLSKKEDKSAGSTKKPKMKQMTLLDLAKSPPAAASPKKRGRSPSTGSAKLGKPLAPMALHLLRFYKENKGKEDKKTTLSSLVSKAAKTLSAEDRGRLPEGLKELVQKRWELFEQKRRWALMTEEEKQDVLRQKRQEIKQKLREKAKERREKEMQMRREMSRRYEDQELEGKSLPTFRLFDMPEGLPNTLFGDIAMVVEFLHCYSGLLMPDDQYPITSIALMEALAGEKAGFLYLNRVLVVLLQTLLQDELAEGYSELDMPLSEIPLTMHSISELVRLCLRPTDAHEEESARGSDDWQPGVGYDDVVSSEFLEKLETSEVFELNSQEKVSLLVALCHRILMTYSVEDHVEATQQRSAELWRERLATLKEVNERKKAEKQKRKEQMEAKTDASGEVLMRADGRKDSNVIKETPKVPAKVEPEPEDMISTVKSRRLMSIQAKKEKEEQERQNKERMEKEAEEERIRKQKAATEKALQDAVTKAKLVLRRTPLGTDRNHNRYWLFSDVVPGLYIEKGWVHESIDYTFTLPPEEEPVSAEEDKEEETEDGEKEDEGSIVSASNENGQQGAPVPESCIETTVPKQGQNLWFVCDSQKDLDELIESLHPQGVRESELKLRLQVNYQEILHSIHLTKKGNPGLKTCDGYQELLKFLRSDIIEVASRLQKGGLGYMEDTSEFEERVRDLEKLQDFGECVITLQESVIKKFLQGFMAPKQKKKKKTGGEESTTAEEVDDQKRLAEEARVATAVEKWKTAVCEAQTCSRMHVLLGMLDACIKWDMSAENARCKVCRRKGEDDKLILCDECNKAFHLFCLRPALYRIPAGEWLCPACQPTTARRSSRGRNYNEDTEEEEDSEEEDEEDSEEEDSEEEYRNTGHSLRPRKKVKSSLKPKVQSKPPQKKHSPPSAKPALRPASKPDPKLALRSASRPDPKPALRSTSRPDLRPAPRPVSNPDPKPEPKPSPKQLPKSRPAPSNPADIDELVRQSSKSLSKKQAIEVEKCEEILQKLIKYRHSWPFREPVSAEEAEDYRDIISCPMDFTTMQDKFKSSQYHNASDFVKDVKLVFSNAEEYNEPDSDVLTCMACTEQAFIELMQKSLPGIGYLRRRSRKRPAAHSEEEEEEDDEEERGKKIQNGKQGRASSRQKEDDEEDSGQRKTRQCGGQWNQDDSESEEDEEEDESVRRKSKRTNRKDYREQDSDNERDSRRTGLRRASSDEDSGVQRHSKRLKRS